MRVKMEGLGKLPKFVSPLSTSYLNYGSRLQQFNSAFQRRLGDAIFAEFGNPEGSDFAVFTTGSDGRLEKGPQSKVEIVVSGRRNYEREAKVVEKEIEKSLGDVLDPDIEHKTLGEHYICGFNSNLETPFPTRVMDLRLLYGDESVKPEALRQLVYEIKSDEGSKIIAGMSGKRRRARSVCEKGDNNVRGKTFIHFDLERGISFYDEKKSESSRLSFKTGPLRLVQYGIVTEILRKIRDDSFDFELLEHLPTPTSDRMYFLETEGRTGLSHGQIESITDSYNYFLWQYHISQETFREFGQTQVHFDVKEVKDRLSDLVRLIGGGRIVR